MMSTPSRRRPLAIQDCNSMGIPARFPHISLSVFVLGGLLCVTNPARAETADFDVLEYRLSVSMTLEKKGVWAPLNTLSATARITFKNSSDAPADRIPLVLHRLMRVESVSVGNGPSLEFSQHLAGIQDWDAYQANVVSVVLDEPLASGSTHTLEITYGGGLRGVQESGMLYVQDTLDPAFTILRAESSVYPHIAEPTRQSLLSAFRGGDGFDQLLDVTVPDGLVVASGHELVDKVTTDGQVTWTYRSEAPGFQIIVAIAPYEVIEVGKNRIFHFAEDSAGAERVAKGIGDAMALFEKWFGPLGDTQSFAVLEIPEWHGSQALRPTVLQEATAFREAEGMGELYHEISHFWNVDDPAPEASRWNEGLATYLQALAEQELGGKEGLMRQEMEGYRERMKQSLEENPEYRDVPLVLAGEKGLTSALSYRGGALFFGLLHGKLGQEELHSILKDYYQQHYESGATSEAFAEFLLTQAPEAQPIVDEWFLGSRYSELLLEGLDFEALLGRYGGE